MNKIIDPADFPLMTSPEYFKVSRVYRMENSDGVGPIVGITRQDNLLRYLKGHMLPHLGIKLNRQVYPECAIFSRELYEPIFKNGVYGWRSREHYDAFFIDDGEERFKAAGFHLVEYEPEIYVPMPDGQVLFLKP